MKGSNFMKKIDEQEVEKAFNKKGFYFLSNSKYINIHTPIDVKDKDGYKYSIAYCHLDSSTNFITFGKRNKFQFDNLQKFCQEHFSNVKLLTVQNRCSTGKTRIFLTFECQCGQKFSSVWEHVKYRNDDELMCPKCAHKKAREKRKDHYNKKYLRSFKKSHYKLINPKQNLYANKPCEVEDMNTGFRGFINPNRLNRSMIIFGEANVKNLVYNLNIYFEKEGITTRAIKIISQNSTNLNDIQVEIKCGSCENTYTTTAHSLTRLNNIYCPVCSHKYSKNEQIFGDYLDSLGIKYIREFRINSCKDIMPLPFDFKLSDYNILIEIDGQQHYEPVTFGGCSKEVAQLHFECVKKHDKIKTDYCKQWNISLLRISYLEIEDGTYKQKLQDFITSHKE